MTYRIRIIKEFLLAFCMMQGAILLSNCTSNADAQKANISVEKHQVQIQDKGKGMIYVDEIPCKAVMQETDTTGSTTCFRCYLIGFIDSNYLAKATDSKSLETGKYFQYDMQNDWGSIVKGDSIKPVFYQPLQRLEGYRHEGVLVFELPENVNPDLLFYNDSYGTWGSQQLIINNNKK